ncbi:MAG: cytochrome c-type biogenesis protein CcmH [Myxococcales bacterium]|nr:cytochrome c-type biogenesis protein CcmH [Myxococcales bacterium]
MVKARLRMLALAGISAALLLGVSTATAAGEATAAPEGWAYKLPHDLMSPFCPGRTIADCSSPQAESLRMWLIVQEASGRSREDVEAELYERYGDVLRPAPRARGFGLTAYVFPVVVFLAGGVVVAVFLRRQTRAAATHEPSSQPSDPELERIIDQELAG